MKYTVSLVATIGSKPHMFVDGALLTAPEPHVLLFRRAKNYAPPAPPVKFKEGGRRK